MFVRSLPENELIKVAVQGSSTSPLARCDVNTLPTAVPSTVAPFAAASVATEFQSEQQRRMLLQQQQQQLQLQLRLQHHKDELQKLRQQQQQIQLHQQRRELPAHSQQPATDARKQQQVALFDRHQTGTFESANRYVSASELLQRNCSSPISSFPPIDPSIDSRSFAPGSGASADATGADTTSPTSKLASSASRFATRTAAGPTNIRKDRVVETTHPKASAVGEEPAEVPAEVPEEVPAEVPAPPAARKRAKLSDSQVASGASPSQRRRSSKDTSSSLPNGARPSSTGGAAAGRGVGWIFRSKTDVLDHPHSTLPFSELANVVRNVQAAEAKQRQDILLRVTELL